MSMHHVSLHDTIDTRSHTAAHTRLLERTPPLNTIYFLRIPILNISITMYIPWIASAIKILCHICCVHYLLCGNTTDINFEDDSRLLSASESHDEN
jgi:hypothetical protein